MQLERNEQRPIGMIRRQLRELSVAFVLGGVPVLLNAEPSEQFKDLVATLLAGPFFLNYYAFLFAALMIAACVQFKFRFNSNRYQAWLMDFHRFMVDVGAGFLTAARTGLGVMLGFLIVWHYVEPDSFNVPNFIVITFLTLCLMFSSSALAFGVEIMNDPKRAAAKK